MEDLLTAFCFRTNDRPMIQDFVTPVSLRGIAKRKAVSQKE
jgi:hypothetical protein